jgi:hypothetical protein
MHIAKSIASGHPSPVDSSQISPRSSPLRIVSPCQRDTAALRDASIPPPASPSHPLCRMPLPLIAHGLPPSSQTHISFIGLRIAHSTHPPAQISKSYGVRYSIVDVGAVLIRVSAVSMGVSSVPRAVSAVLVGCRPSLWGFSLQDSVTPYSSRTVLTPLTHPFSSKNRPHTSGAPTRVRSCLPRLELSLLE